MSNRVQRVNSLIQKELGKIFLQELDFSDVLVTITRVDCSSNLIQAKIYISVIPDSKKKDVFFNLNKKIYDIQQRLNSRLKMRPIPKIEFIEEKETEKAARVEELLGKMNNNKS